MSIGVRAIVSPSVLAADFSKLGLECEKVVTAGAEWIHLDVMDGHFVPNISFGFPVISSVGKFLAASGSNVVKDVHIMITDPMKWVNELSDCGASHVSFHLEACPSTEYAIETARNLREHGMTAGIAVKPKTPIDQCIQLLELTREENLFSLVLVMTVEPGFGGQKFDSSVLCKCAAVRQKFPSINIQLDGGINAETAVLGAKAGANVMVAGTSVFASPDVKQAISAIRSAIQHNCENIQF